AMRGFYRRERAPVTEFRSREREYHLALASLADLKDAADIHRSASGKLGQIQSAIRKKTHGTMATKVMSGAVLKFSGLLDELADYLKDQELRSNVLGRS
ncbi:MAG: hypothetical protein Q8P02_03020, partial [Candidatus Micrarchaeota archaeon]|nr:hypothetical protein [Candidatus Micrarchaeota archaeon]